MTGELERHCALGLRSKDVHDVRQTSTTFRRFIIRVALLNGFTMRMRALVKLMVDESCYCCMKTRPRKRLGHTKNSIDIVGFVETRRIGKDGYKF